MHQLSRITQMQANIHVRSTETNIFNDTTMMSITYFIILCPEVLFLQQKIKSKASEILCIKCSTITS